MCIPRAELLFSHVGSVPRPVPLASAKKQKSEPAKPAPEPVPSGDSRKWADLWSSSVDEATPGRLPFETFAEMLEESEFDCTSGSVLLLCHRLGFELEHSGQASERVVASAGAAVLDRLNVF